MLAVISNCVQVVKYFLESKLLIDINEKNENGFSALMLACFMGHEEIIKLLLKEKNIQIYQKSVGALSAFLSACYWGNLKIVKLLFTKNSNCDFVDGNSAFTCAYNNNHIEIAIYLVELGLVKMDDPYMLQEMARERGDLESLLVTLDDRIEILKEKEKPVTEILKTEKIFLFSQLIHEYDNGLSQLIKVKKILLAQ